ncbi:hypothetical protein [Actinophytocola sediminis]
MTDEPDDRADQPGQPDPADRTGPDGPNGPTGPHGRPDSRARRRGPSLDEIFGDVLPATTSDERDPEGPSGDTDSWYERNRPPHHDRD